MQYVIGVDGGGTKTVCALANENGDIVNILRSGCTNHQICGLETAVERISGLIDDILSSAELCYEDVKDVYLGLSGADFPSDVATLRQAMQHRFPSLRLEVVNDIWLVFASENYEGWGAVSICGTGHNAAVMQPDGETYGIWALKDTLGNYGGGRQITDSALHYAFRSFQQTGPHTRLEDLLPQLCGVLDMNQLAFAVYNSNYEYQHQFAIPSLVFQLAEEGDEVCRRLVRESGAVMGEILGGLIRKSKLEAHVLPVALGGALYTSKNNGLLLQSFREGLGNAAPAYDFRLAKSPPVAGALITALKNIGVNVDAAFSAELAANIRNFLSVNKGVELI